MAPLVSCLNMIELLRIELQFLYNIGHLAPDNNAGDTIFTATHLVILSSACRDNQTRPSINIYLDIF